MKKNKIINLYDLIENPAYSSYLDVDYCTNNYNCQCPDYCRCGVIQVNSKKFNKDIFSKELEDCFDDLDLKYCVNRLINASDISEDNFSAYGVSGYYGEEIQIKMNDISNHEVFALFNQAQTSTLDEKIKLLLKFEYGYIIDSIKDKVNLSFQKINVNDIVFNDAYYKQIKSLDKYGESYILPRGIFIKDGPKFKLIDGYHRTSYAKNILNHKTIKGYVYE